MRTLSKKQLASILILVIFVLSIFLVGSSVDAIHTAGHGKSLELNYPSIPGPNGPLTLDINTTLPKLIEYLYTFFISIAGLIAFASFVFAGFLFMTSGANPALRKQAQNRIQQAVLGLVVLLGAYIILSIINPELVLLHEPGIDPRLDEKISIPDIAGVLDNVDYSTLRYGGVILYAESALDGNENKSETILNDIENFSDGTFIGNDLSALRILGNCELQLYAKIAMTGPIIAKPSGPVGTIATDDAPSPHFSNDDVESLEFTNTGCLGHSITVYSADGFKHQTKVFITSDIDLRDNKLLLHRDKLYHFSAEPHNANDNIEAIKFAFSDSDNFSIKVCKDDGEKGKCAVGLNKDVSKISTATEPPTLNKLENEITSITFSGGGEGRQAGVILYEKDKFDGKSEIFIASDKNFVGNWLGQDNLSSLKIIGEYKVTLYEHGRDTDDGGRTLTFDNTGGSLIFSNSFTGFSDQEPEPSNAGGIINIPQLSKYSLDEENVWNDKISAIKIEVPEEIYNKQKLGPSCAPVSGLCEL